MKNVYRHILGYAIGFTLFFLLIPYGFIQLSTLDTKTRTELIDSSVLRLIIALPFFLTGAFFAIWSNVFLLLIGKGGPVEGFGVAISPPSKNLVTSGPYRFCRNPMVLGAFLFYLSFCIYFNSLIGIVVLFLFFLAMRQYLKRSEEKRLTRDFGQEYLEYKKRVPMIFPRIFLLRTEKSVPVNNP